MCVATSYSLTSSKLSMSSPLVGSMLSNFMLSPLLRLRYADRVVRDCPTGSVGSDPSLCEATHAGSVVLLRRSETPHPCTRRAPQRPLGNAPCGRSPPRNGHCASARVTCTGPLPGACTRMLLLGRAENPASFRLSSVAWFALPSHSGTKGVDQHHRAIRLRAPVWPDLARQTSAPFILIEGAIMSRSGKVIDLAKANPLGRLIQSAMSAAASAFGVALIAEPCYAVAALAESATSCGGC